MKYELASSSWDQKEVEAIQSVIDRDMYTMNGSVQEFEKQFAEFVGSKYSVMVNSGSSANLLAIAALFYRSSDSLKPGDEVIVPAVSWPTTYYPVSQYGLKLKFVDIDHRTLNMDLNALESAITEKTRAIFAVNILGNPNNFEKINKIIKDKDIILLEDNCESLGAIFQDKQAGTFGLMGTYSSFFSHHISTMEGGLVVTDDEELYHILLCLRSHGWTRHLPKENKLCTKSEDPFEESFRFILPGYNLRPIEMSGAIGLEQLKKLPNFIQKRRENAEVFKKLFMDDPNFIIQSETGKSSWFGFSFIINPDSGISRQKLTSTLLEKKIDCRPIVAGNFAKNKVVELMEHEIHGELKNSNLIDTHGFFVGNHHYDISAPLTYLREVLSDLLK